VTWVADKLLGFDIESTGTDPETALPVSFALAWVDFGNMERVRAGLINPGVPIPEDATKVHKITDADVAERGGDLARSIEGIVGILVEASAAGMPLVGMNLPYDLTVIDRCAQRIMGEGLRDQGWEGACLDVLVIDRGVDRYRKGKRNLGALCQTYGVTLDDAHSAVADVVASVQVLHEITRRYPELLDLSLDEIHGKQIAWQREWAENYDDYRAGRGDPPLDPREHDWPIRGDGDAQRADDARGGEEPISARQASDLARLVSDRFGVSDRQDRLNIVSGLAGREVSSTKELSVAEFKSVAKDIAALDDDAAEDAAEILMAEAQERRGGVRPTLAQEPSEPPPGADERPEASAGAPGPSEGVSGDDSGPDEGFTPSGLDGIDPEILTTTMRHVMALNGTTINDVLRQYGLKRTGSVNDRRLRLYEFACRERAAGNEEVERIFSF
jgi:DNA polymerase III subunit epsilon